MLMEQSSNAVHNNTTHIQCHAKMWKRPSMVLDANTLHLDCAADHEHDVNLFFGCWMNEHSMQIYSAKVISAFIVRIMQFSLNRIAMWSPRSEMELQLIKYKIHEPKLV